MKQWPFLLGCLVVAVIFGLVYWPKLKEWQSVPEPVVSEQPTSVPMPPPIKHPVDEIATESETAPDLELEEPLPELEQSDARMEEILARLFREQDLARYFLLEHFIERLVAMVDNLPRSQLPATHRPLKKIPGRFQVVKDSENLVIDPANYKRYTALLDALRKIDPEQAVSVYVHLYPLFQQAYTKLGYRGGYFNDRLLEVIDHLLEAPLISGPVCLVKPKYYYQFADPEFEALSAGHKIMLRIGPDNADRVKALLRVYRQKLAGRPAPGH